MSKICILGREKLKNTCDFCGESFQNSDELNTHVVSVHEEPNNYEISTSYFEPVVQVDVLDPEENADTFETNYFEPETVIEEPKYHCSKCEKSFEKLNVLKSHMALSHKINSPVVQEEVLNPEEDADTFETDYFEPETVIEEDMYDENLESDSGNIFVQSGIEKGIDETIVPDQGINPMPSTSSQLHFEEVHEGQNENVEILES